MGEKIEVLSREKNYKENLMELLEPKKKLSGPGQVAQLVGAFSRITKGCRFDSQSGHIPRLRVQSLFGAHMGGKRPKFLSHKDVSLSLSPTSLPSF